MQKILIYSPEITRRIRYVFDFILNEFSGIETEYTTDKEQLKSSEIPSINYSKEKIGNEIHFPSDDFMFDSEISDAVIFDRLNPVGMIFYALSRYEEYLPNPRDRHERLSGVGRVYRTPFVDVLIIEFQKQLKDAFPDLEFKKRKFEIILTSDVDQAWKYKHKGFVRTCGGLLTDLFKGDFKEISKKRAVIWGGKKDPFDSFDYFKSLKEKYDFQMIFFWLLGDYAKFDKNSSPNNGAFRRKIREVSEWSDFGIHPSYESSKYKIKLKVEIGRLAGILEKPVHRSRQHYIKLNLPETYRNLIENKITDDYTMAYADVTGFRAGTTTAFHWYDLKKEEITKLKIHPFCAMDVSMRNYMKLSAEESIRELARLKSEIKKVDGQMILLFHNSNLDEGWEGWKEVLESVME
ncbi:MAG: polysaccharide deacetylase family protein [Moheibacter sp.]